MNLNRLRDALSPSAAGERPRNESEDGDEREPVFTTRTAAASGGAAVQFDTAAYTDVRGQAQDLGSDLEQEEAVTSLGTQDAMRVAESLSVEGPKQALSLGLMAQKKLQDVQFFVDNEAFSSFPKDQQEQLLKDLLQIELARNVLSNFASNSANSSAAASLTRLEQLLSTDPVWLMLSTTDAAPAAKINQWMIKTAHKLAEILEVDIAQRLGEQISPPAASSAASTRTVTIRSGENASAMSPFPVNNKPEKPGLEQTLLLYHMIEKAKIMTPLEGKTLRNLEHAVSKHAWLALQYSSWVLTKLKRLRLNGIPDTDAIDHFYLHIQQLFNMNRLYRLSLEKLKKVAQTELSGGSSFCLNFMHEREVTLQLAEICQRHSWDFDSAQSCGEQLLKQMLPLYKKEFLHIAAGDDEWRVGVRSGFESILESHEQKCMYELFEIVDEYFDAVDNSKEPAVEEFDKKTSFAKMAQPRFRQRATSAIFSATPEEADSSKSPVSARSPRTGTGPGGVRCAHDFQPRYWPEPGTGAMPPMTGLSRAESPCVFEVNKRNSCPRPKGKCQFSHDERVCDMRTWPQDVQEVQRPLRIPPVMPTSSSAGGKPASTKTTGAPHPMSKGSRDSKTARNRSQRPGQSVMQTHVGEVIIDSSEDEIEIRLIQVCRRLEGHPAFHVPVATKPIDIEWKPSVAAKCANEWRGAASSSSAFSLVQSPVSDMELMFELEVQSADVKALDVGDLPDSISMAVSFKQNRHLSELEEYRSGANSNDVAKDGAAMHTDRRYLHQRALTRPVYQRLEEENLHIFGGHDHPELPVVVTHPQGGGVPPSMPMWLLSQSRRFPAPPDVWAHASYPPDREDEYDQWAASQDPITGWQWTPESIGQDHVFYTSGGTHVPARRHYADYGFVHHKPKVLMISPGLKIYRQAHGYQRSVDQIFDTRCGVLQREITGMYHNAQAMRPNFRGSNRVNALRRGVTDYLLFQMNHGYISLNWVDSDEGIAFEVHQVVQPPSRNSGHRGVWAVGRETTRYQDFPADCQLLDVQSSPGLKFKHMPDGLDANAVRFGEMVGTHFSQDPYDVLESWTAPRFRTCESVLLLNLFQDASFARVHSIFEDKLHKVVVLENNFDKIGHPLDTVHYQPASEHWHSWFPHLSDADAMVACGFPSNIASSSSDHARGQLLELNLLASSYQTDYYLSGQTNDVLLDDDPILDAPTPWRDIRNIIRDSKQIADYPAGTMRRNRHTRSLRHRFGDYRVRNGGAASGSAEMPGQPTKRQQWISHGNCSRNAAIRLVKLIQLWQHARQVRADFTIFMEAIPHFEKLSHTWPLILEFVGPNSFPYGRILSVDARIRLLGYSTEEVMHPDWEEELQDSGSAQWRVFSGEEEQMVPNAVRVGDLVALGDGTIVQTDVKGNLDGTYPIFMGRSKLVSREQFREPDGRDSISSQELSGTSSCVDEDARAGALIEDNSGTVFENDQGMRLSEESNLQQIAIGACGYATPSETPAEASRRVEHAGSTPPSTPAPDSEFIIDETAEDSSHLDSHGLDASYPLAIAQGQPPMERHLVPLSAVQTVVPSPALPTVFPTPFPFWDAPLTSSAGFAAVPQSIQVYTFAASSATEPPSSSAVNSSVLSGGTLSTNAQVSASTVAGAEVQTGSVSQVSPPGQSATASRSFETQSSQPTPWNSLSVLDAASEVSVSLEQSSTPMPSAHATATTDYPSRLKRDRNGNLCRWKPTVGTPANHGISSSNVAAPLRAPSDVSSARSKRSMQRDATLISTQRADASTTDARAAEYDRHLTDLEEYRSGKNKNDVASDGASMAEPQVKDGKLLRQRKLTTKELRMGGEFSECVDCDGAMDSSSGSTPFLKGGEIAQSLMAQGSANQGHFGPPEAAEDSTSVEFASSAQHNASASAQSQLAQTDVNREYEAVASLMEMHGRLAASSSDSTVLLASGSVSTNAALKPWRLKDQRVSRAGRDQSRTGRVDTRNRAGRQQVDSRVGKPRNRSKDRPNKKRPNDNAAAPAQDAPVQVAEEAPRTRALNLRRFTDAQELPLQVAATVANEHEIRLRIVAVEDDSNVESSFVTSAIALARDIRGTQPSVNHTTVPDPTAEDAVDRFVESEQMVVEASQLEHAVPSLLELHTAQDLQLVSQTNGLSLNDPGDDSTSNLQREVEFSHQPTALFSAAAVVVSAPLEEDTIQMFPPESYRTPNKPIVQSKQPPPPPSPRRLGASLFMISSEEETLPNVMSMLRRAHPQPYVLLYDQKGSDGRRSVICLCDSGAASFNIMAERVYLEARKRNPARFDTYHPYERPLPVSGIEASRKEVCIVGRTNQKLYCPITERQLCFPTVILQNASTGDAEVIFGNRQGASNAWGTITDLGNMEYTIRQVGDGSPDPLVLDMVWNPDAAAMQALARLLINKEREACDVHLTSEEITNLVEASSSEQHSEELPEQALESFSELPLDDLEEVLIKVAEVGLDLQENSTKLPSEQLSPRPPVFEDLARSCSELSTPIEASQGSTATMSIESPMPSVRFSAARKEASLEASRGLVMPRHPTPHPANAHRERERQERFNAQARHDGHLSRIMGVIPFNKMNGAELTETIKNLSSLANEQQRVLLELIAVKGTIAEGSLCQHCQALAWTSQDYEMFNCDEHLPGLMALNEILGGRCASCDRLRGPHGPGRRVECIRALFNKALMFRTFEAQHARAMQNQLRMCVVEKETSMKMFLQTETPVSPAWSSDELSPQKANASGGHAADEGDFVERNLFCSEFDAAAILDGQSETGDDGANGAEQHRQPPASSSAELNSESQSAAEKVEQLIDKAEVLSEPDF